MNRCIASTTTDLSTKLLHRLPGNTSRLEESPRGDGRVTSILNTKSQGGQENKLVEEPLSLDKNRSARSGDYSQRLNDFTPVFQGNTGQSVF